MIDKIVQSMADAMAGIKDGSTVLLGGFGAVGQPNALIDGLIEQGATDLTVACQQRRRRPHRPGAADGTRPRPQDHLLVPALAPTRWCSKTLYRAGKIELEIVPQGTLAERMRAAGAGVPAFFTATGVGTKMAIGKEIREFDGRSYVLEHALQGDVGLVEAWEADRWGNLTFKRVGPQLQSGDRHGIEADHRADPAHPRTGRDRPRPRRHARHLRGPRAACALR